MLSSQERQSQVCVLSTVDKNCFTFDNSTEYWFSRVIIIIIIKILITIIMITDLSTNTTQLMLEKV